ncbi:hypothetical protein BDW59DRAFT_163123 [Aspergillus cavernicola]|uniref:Rhodopsin domain-containing protein n=1 Tax=Aspergillus cavernicola TaxID=176166 RepID=A0ABR4I768_9EURO
MNEDEKPAVVAQSTLYTLIWVEFGICTIVVGLRAYSQLLVVRRPCLDDLVMLGAYILQGVASGLCTASAYWGQGSDFSELLRDRKAVVNMLKFAMISMPFGVLGPMLARISFILFLIVTVLTVHNLRRKSLWVLIVLQVVINAIPIIMQFTLCRPLSGMWDPFEHRQACRAGKIVQQYGFFQGAFNALTDLILIVTGLLVIIHLKLRLQTKVALCVILSLSSLAMIAAILKTIQLQLMVTASTSYAYAMWTIWFLTEGTVLIITASVPRIRPLIILRNKHKRDQITYNSGFSNEVRPSQYRFGASLFHDRTLSRPGQARMHWLDRDNDNDSESHDLIVLGEEGEAGRGRGRSLQKI